MKDGGPAFPVTTGEQRLGMSLRDYFAAHAMGQFLPWNHSYPDEAIARDHERALAEHVSNLSKTAYAIADAMLAARERP